MSDDIPKKILVVDDEEDVLTPLCNILRRSGYDVSSTTRGREAVKLAMEILPDLIILDIVLPDMGGSEVASTLIGNPPTADIPIIFLTGILTREEETNIGSLSGRSHVVAKPITGHELLDMVNKVFVA